MHRQISYLLASTPIVRGHILIAVGLALLLASTWIPALPVVTAMAILTLGATDATIERYRSSPAGLSVLVLHATTYGALYGIFIAATLHATGKSPNASIGAATAFDLAFSTLPIFIAVRHIAAAARGV